MVDIDDIKDSIDNLASDIRTLSISISQIDACISGDWKDAQGRRAGIQPLVEVIEKLITAIYRSQK
jgi:hypothetical protein